MGWEKQVERRRRQLDRVPLLNCIECCTDNPQVYALLGCMIRVLVASSGGRIGGIFRVEDVDYFACKVLTITLLTYSRIFSVVKYLNSEKPGTLYNSFILHYLAIDEAWVEGYRALKTGYPVCYSKGTPCEQPFRSCGLEDW